MEGKIGDLGTARLVDPRRQSRMTQAPGTAHFMPPEALAEDVTNIHYGKELDVFSFGCVMLHTLSHEWPTPSQAVIINPETGLVTGGRSEVKRRSKYFERIDRSRSDVLIPLIESCLSNLPKNRPSILRVCDQLEDKLVDRESVSTNELTLSALQQELRKKDVEIQQKDSEIQRKDNEIQRNYNEIQRKNAEIQHLTTALHDKDVTLETLRADMSKLQITTSHPLPNKVSKQSFTIITCVMFQVDKSSSDFWNSLKLTWQQCSDLPEKYWATSVAELDGKVYVTVVSKYAHFNPLMYDSSKDQWSILPELPYVNFSLVTVPDRKQLLAIGGTVSIGGVHKITIKVCLWDEMNQKWTTPYPNMPTVRFNCSSISHRLTVIVAGGVTCWDPWTMTRAVEVLHIKEHGLFTKSYWSKVEQLSHFVRNAIPLIVNDKLYITVGCDKKLGASTCNNIIVTASLPELLQSSNKKTTNNQVTVWCKLPDMPYSSSSINHYQGRLITFCERYHIEQPDTGKAVYKSVPLIHIYNLNTHTWDCVGEIPHGYLLGYSVHIAEDKILFIGGGTFCADKDDYIITTCTVLTLSQ